VLIPLVALTVSAIFENYHFSLLSTAGVALVLAGNALALTGRIRAN
jgi:drug/metabolite transporter (DMT)-like permease